MHAPSMTVRGGSDRRMIRALVLPLCIAGRRPLIRVLTAGFSKQIRADGAARA